MIELYDYARKQSSNEPNESANGSNVRETGEWNTKSNSVFYV